MPRRGGNSNNQKAHLLLRSKTLRDHRSVPTAGGFFPISALPTFCSYGAMKKYSIGKIVDGLCFDYIYT